MIIGMLLRRINSFLVSTEQRLASRPTRSINRTTKRQRTIRNRQVNNRLLRQHFRLLRHRTRTHMRISTFRVFTSRSRHLRHKISQQVLSTTPRDRRIVNGVTLLMSILNVNHMFNNVNSVNRHRLRMLRRAQTRFQTRGRNIIRYKDCNQPRQVEVKPIMRRTIRRPIRILRVFKRIRYIDRQARNIRVNIRRAVMRQRRLIRHNRNTLNMSARPVRIIYLKDNSRERQITTKLIRRIRRLHFNAMFVLRTKFKYRRPHVLRSTALQQISGRLTKRQQMSDRTQVPRIHVLTNSRRNARVTLTQQRLTNLQIRRVSVARLGRLLNGRSAQLLLSPINRLLAYNNVRQQAGRRTMATNFNRVLSSRLTRPVRSFLTINLRRQRMHKHIIRGQFLTRVMLSRLQRRMMSNLIVNHTITQHISSNRITHTMNKRSAKRASRQVEVRNRQIRRFIKRTTMGRTRAITFTNMIRRMSLIIRRFRIFKRNRHHANFLHRVNILRRHKVMTTKDRCRNSTLNKSGIRNFTRRTQMFTVVTGAGITRRTQKSTTLSITRRRQMTNAQKSTRIIFRRPPTTILTLSRILTNSVHRGTTKENRAISLQRMTNQNMCMFLQRRTIVSSNLIKMSILRVNIRNISTLLRTLLRFIMFIKFSGTQREIMQRRPIVMFTILMSTRARAITKRLSVSHFTAICRFVNRSTYYKFSRHTYSLL